MTFGAWLLYIRMVFKLGCVISYYREMWIWRRLSRCVKSERRFQVHRWKVTSGEETKSNYKMFFSLCVFEIKTKKKCSTHIKKSIRPKTPVQICLQVILMAFLTLLYFIYIWVVLVKDTNLFVPRKDWYPWVNGECLNTVFWTLLTVTCHSSNPVLCDPDIQQPVPARLPCPLRPVSAFIRASQVTKRPSQWINIKILFRGIRLGNILPSNAALARAKARQGINY